MRVCIMSLLSNKDVHCADSKVEVPCGSKTACFYTRGCSLPEYSTDSGADDRQGAPTFVLSVTDIRSAFTHLPTSTPLPVYNRDKRSTKLLL